jgi:hypothetical protein
MKVNKSYFKSLFIKYKLFVKWIRKLNCFLSCMHFVNMCLFGCDALVSY